MVEDYSKLKIAELLRLLEDGDIKAKQTLDAHYAELRQISIEEKTPIFLDVYQSILKDQQQDWFIEAQDPGFSQLFQLWSYEHNHGVTTTKLRKVKQMTEDWAKDNQEYRYWRSLLNIKVFEDYQPWLKSFLDTFPPDSEGALSRDIGRSKEGDIEALERLAETHYSQGKILYHKKLQLIRDYYNLRQHQAFEEDKPYTVWWTHEIVMPALILVLNLPEFDIYRHSSDVYQLSRGKVASEVEKDLTDGHTIKSKERLNILLMDTKIIQEEIEDDEDIFFDVIASTNSFDPNAPEEDLDLELLNKLHNTLSEILGKLTLEENMIIKQSEYGDTDELSQKLGLETGAIRTRRHRIKKKIIKALRTHFKDNDEILSMINS